MAGGDTLDSDAGWDRRRVVRPDGSHRRGDSTKWSRYAADVLPAWVADMDFRAPQPIVDALRERAAVPDLGYADPPVELAAAIAAFLDRRHRWAVDPSTIVHLPGLVNGFNVVIALIGDRGDGVAVHTPVYPPMLAAPAIHGRLTQTVPMAVTRTNASLRYELDLDRLSAAITSRTKLLLWCSPHNPTGQVFTRSEVESVAELCLRHDLWICSDEIWCDLRLDDGPHIPIAAVDESVAARTVTLMAPSKSFNVPAMGYAFAVAPDPRLRARLESLHGATYASPNVLAYHGALAAYTRCDDWLGVLCAYLRRNRDAVVAHAADRWPRVAATTPGATYLAWFDVADLDLGPDPAAIIEQQARVALSAGVPFGPDSQSFVRLNFGCPRARLDEILERLDAVLG